MDVLYTETLELQLVLHEIDYTHQKTNFRIVKLLILLSFTDLGAEIISLCFILDISDLSTTISRSKYKLIFDRIDSSCEHLIQFQ